jgi:DNA-directed RNA polymerase alpha subunit
MMENATEQLILKELRETRLIAEKVLYTVAGREWTNEFLGRIEEEAKFQRFIAETRLYKLDLNWKAREALEAVDVLTVEDAAARSREELAAVPGVGPRTLERLDAEFAERGLAYAGAS